MAAVLALMVGMILAAALESGWTKAAAIGVGVVLSVLLTIAKQRRAVMTFDRLVRAAVAPVVTILWFLVMLTPAMLVYSGTKWLSDSAPRWLSGTAALFVSLALVAIVAWKLYQPRGRALVKGKLGNENPVVALVVGVNLVFAFVGIFSSMTLALPADWTLFVGEPRPDHGLIADFYLWNFMDMLPLVEFNETVMWEEPLKAAHPSVGWLLLLFKVTVILPAFWVMATYFRTVAGAVDESGPDLG